MMWIAELTLGARAPAVSHARGSRPSAKGLLGLFRAALARRQTRRALAGLSDHQLRDIGLHRGATTAAADGVVEPESAAFTQPARVRSACQMFELPSGESDSPDPTPVYTRAA